MRKRSVVTAVTLGAIVIAGVASFSWWRAIDRHLTERPPRSGGHSSIPTTESSVHISAVIPYAALGEALTASVPQDINDQGRQHVCVEVNKTLQQTVEETFGGTVGQALGTAARAATTAVMGDRLERVCQDVDYRTVIHRDGPITVVTAPSGHELRLSVPISVSGEVGFTGDMARALALDRKSFRGSITAFADVALNIGTDWCPRVEVKPDFVWRDKAQLEVVSGVWINIDGTVGPKLKEALQNAAHNITSVVTCDQVKTAVAPLWHPYAWPVGDGRGASAYVNLTPRKIGLSGFRYEGNGIRMALGITATTEVSTTPLPTPTTLPDLPPLASIDAVSNELSLSIPLRASYEEVERALTNALSTGEFEVPTPAGNCTVLVSAVSVYPAGNQLVLGLRFDARFDTQVADVKGWVYLVGEPSLDTQSQTVKLKNIAFTRAVDNKLWSILSAVFRGRIQQMLEERALLALQEEIDALRVRVNNDLVTAARKQGFNVVLNDAFVGLKQVNVADNNLEILVGFEGTADVSVERIIQVRR